MTVSLDQAEAQAVLEAKLALEAELAPRLAAVMRQYLGLWLEGGGRVGWIPKADAVSTLVAVLEAHFARIVLVISGRKPFAGATISEAALTSAQAESLRHRARTQAKLIIDGLDKRLAHTLALVRTGRKDLTADLAEMETKADGGVIDRPPPALEPTPTTGYQGDLQRAIDHVRGELAAKAKAGANMATNPVANETRKIIVGEPGDADGQVMQRWHNQQDDRVRHPPRSAFDHVEAHGQTVPVTSHYTVSGEKLRFPGDVGLGASIGNTVNCRCFSSFILRKPDGTEVPLYTMPWAPAKRMRKPGDRVGREIPATPTSRVTLNGKTKAKVVLKDGTLATLEQVRPDTLVVRVGRETIGRVVIQPDGTLGQIAIRAGQEARDILGLMQRSVDGTAQWMRSTNRIPPWAR